MTKSNTSAKDTQQPRSRQERTQTRAGLPRYVSYAEIKDACGLDKRQIQRLMSKGKFPRPVPVGTKANVWLLEDVLTYLEACRTGLAALAVTQPEKLKPEHVADAAYELAARHISNVAGLPVEPEQVLLGRLATPQERSAALTHRAEQIEQAMKPGSIFADLELDRQVYVVNWLFPALGRLLRRSNGEALPRGEQARRLGIVALNDRMWEEAVSGKSKTPAKGGESGT